MLYHTLILLTIPKTSFVIVYYDNATNLHNSNVTYSVGIYDTVNSEMALKYHCYC
jgi:hypothetical protein